MNQPKTKAPRSKKIPWVAFVLLGIVVLACESPAPTYVCVVEADPTVAGKAFAQVESVNQICPSDQTVKAIYGQATVITPAVYETDDYGQSWHQLNDPPPEWKSLHTPHNVAGLTAHDGSLWLNEQPILKITRPPLTQLFENTGDPFGAPDLLLSSSAPPGQGVLYAAMGQYGILVGPNPAENSDRGWTWSQHDFPYLYSPSFPPMTVNDPAGIGRIIAFFLAVPPLPLVLGWLLAQAWRYMYPLDESRKAMRLGWGVSIVITVVYAITIALWLRDPDTNFYAMMGGAGVFSIMISVAVGVLVARRRQFTDAFVRKSVLVTASLTLIAPIGVMLATTQIGWPLILSLTIGFTIYRRALLRYLDRVEAHATSWQVDRLALEIMALFLLMFVPIGLLSFAVLQNGALLVIGLVIVPLLGLSVASAYIKWRGRNFMLKKKAAPLEVQDTPLFDDTVLYRPSLWWLGWATGISLTTIVAQQFMASGSIVSALFFWLRF